MLFKLAATLVPASLDDFGPALGSLAVDVALVGAAPVDHREVTDVAGAFAPRLGELLSAILPKI